MLLSEAKAYIGKVCSICWRDRKGAETTTISKVYDATFVPLYGGYVVTDADDIRLDRISAMTLVEAAPQTTQSVTIEDKVTA